MRNHETTLKIHGNQLKTMRNHETTLKNRGNQPKTIKTIVLRYVTNTGSKLTTMIKKCDVTNTGPQLTSFD